MNQFTVVITALQSSIKVAALDDNLITREGLMRLISATPGLTLSGAFSRPEEVLGFFKKTEPDILLLGEYSGFIQGMDLMLKLLNYQPNLKIILFTTSETKTNVIEAFKHGARGYVLKSSEWAQVVRAIQGVASGCAMVSPKTLASQIFNTSIIRIPGSARHVPKLIDREVEVLELVASGKSNEQIGHVLGLATSTIKKHCHNSMCKLGKNSRGAAAIEAIRLGLIQLDFMDS